MKQNEISYQILKSLNRCLGPSRYVVNPLDLLHSDCKNAADVLFKSTVVAGVFFDLVSVDDEFWQLVSECELVELVPGLLAIVADQSPYVVDHSMWRQVKKAGGDSWYGVRATWQLYLPGKRIEDLRPGMASGLVLESGDELIDVVQLCPTLQEGSQGFPETLDQVWQVLSTSLDVSQDLADVALRFVGEDRAVLVRNSCVGRASHELWKSVLQGECLDFRILTLFEASLECPGRVGYVDYPDGYCYLHLVKPGSRLIVQSVLGAYPSLQQLLQFESKLIDGYSCRRAFVTVSEGLCHVGKAPVSGGLTIGELPVYVDIGGDSGHGKQPEVGTVSQVSGRFLRFLAGKDRGIFVYRWGSEVNFDEPVQRDSEGFVSARPAGITRDGFYRFSVTLSACSAECLVLPKGVYLDVEDARLGSQVYPTYVLFDCEARFDLLCQSPYTYDHIGSLLPPGVSWSSCLDKRLQASWSLKLAVLGMDKYASAYRASSVYVDWRDTDFKVARDNAETLVFTLPVRMDREERRVKVIDLHDPLDDWLSCYKRRVEIEFSQFGDVREALPDSVRFPVSVISKLRLRTGLRPDLACVEFDCGLRVYGSQCSIAVVNRNAAASFKPVGFGDGDAVSWRVKALCDAYCYEDGGESVGYSGDDDWDVG